MECECENTSQSRHPSPGPVDDQENLIRLVFSPEMIDMDGKLKNSAIPSADLERQIDGEAPLRGCSMFRELFLTQEILEKEALGLANGRKSRESAWSFRCATHELRALMALSDGLRSVCIVDQAEVDNISHAELWGGRAGRSKGVIKAVRDQITSLLVPVGRII